MDEIVLTEYNPAWPGLFAQEEALMRRVLPQAIVTRVEHFGSTSIPGMVAKPVIDIMLGVYSLEEAKQKAVPILESLGYSYWRDDPRKDHLFLVKGLPPNGPRSHHIHIVEPSNSDWDRLLFRDFLRAHPDEAVRYTELKRDLAERHKQDRDAYTDAKAEYISGVMQLARQERINGLS